MIKLCYFPGLSEPLSVDIHSEVRPDLPLQQYFSYDNMADNISTEDLEYDTTQLGTFYNENLSFNRPFSNVV